MCTLTIIPDFDEAGASAGYRLMTNRDERCDRPRAEPPSRRQIGDRTAVWPRDPSGGGTWIALNDRALTLSILNLNLDPPPSEPRPSERLSRGRIIPRLIETETAEQAMARLREMDLTPFDPFRLIAVDPTAVRLARWDRAELMERAFRLSSLLSTAETAVPLKRDVRAVEPTCLVSSGLGDHVVAPRLDLFREWFADRGLTAEAQDAFHEHRWPDRPEISVMMSREDARTVSITTVEAPADAEQSVRMRYRECGMLLRRETHKHADADARACQAQSTGRTPVSADQQVEVCMPRADSPAATGPRSC